MGENKKCEKTAFQLLLVDAANLAKECSKRLLTLAVEQDMYLATLADTIMLYLSSCCQAGTFGKKRLYTYVKSEYGDAGGQTYNLYHKHEKKIRGQLGEQVRSYDAADFIGIEARVNATDPLSERVRRRNIHLSKNLTNPKFAEAFRDYDKEYESALMETGDENYVANSIYFYRKENCMAFSLIAHVADYLNRAGCKEIDFELAKPFWTYISVENLAENVEPLQFVVAPNVLAYLRYIEMASPEYLNGCAYIYGRDAVLQAVEEKVRVECEARTLKQNVFELLPLPEKKYGNFDVREIASFIRTCYPIMEKHQAVSFYKDKACTQPDHNKIELARKVMKGLYSFE